MRRKRGQAFREGGAWRSSARGAAFAARQKERTQEGKARPQGKAAGRAYPVGKEAQGMEDSPTGEEAMRHEGRKRASGKPALFARKGRKSACFPGGGSLAKQCERGGLYSAAKRKNAGREGAPARGGSGQSLSAEREHASKETACIRTACRRPGGRENFPIKNAKREKRARAGATIKRSKAYEGRMLFLLQKRAAAAAGGSRHGTDHRGADRGGGADLAAV